MECKMVAIDNSEFVKIMRYKRNKLKARLRKCEDLNVRDTLTLKIESMNIIISEFDEVPMADGRRTRYKTI